MGRLLERAGRVWSWVRASEQEVGTGRQPGMMADRSATPESQLLGHLQGPTDPPCGVNGPSEQCDQGHCELHLNSLFVGSANRQVSDLRNSPHSTLFRVLCEILAFLKLFKALPSTKRIL